jgi:hypothetical protein
MRRWISPYFLERVPVATFESATRIFDAFKAVSQTLPIMDPPYELRQLIWSSFRHNWVLYDPMIFSHGFSADDWRSVAPLLRLSKAICKEVVPIMPFNIDAAILSEEIKQITGGIRLILNKGGSLSLM